VEGRTSSFLGRNVVLCVSKIAYELTRFRVLVILFPYLSTAYEQILALQTSVVTEQTVYEVCEITGSHGSEYKIILLVYCVMQSSRNLSAFPKCLLPPSSGPDNGGNKQP
jgi:hypothetical protein